MPIKNFEEDDLMPSFRQERKLTAFQVTSLQKCYAAMDQAYAQQQFGEALSYARSLIEITCKYIYHDLTGKELEIEHGYLTKDGDYEIGLHRMIAVCLDQLAAIVPPASKMERFDAQLVKLVALIGQLRNDSLICHGSRKRTKPLQPAQTCFVLQLAEDICLLLLNVLYDNRRRQSGNLLGSLIDPSGLVKQGSTYLNQSEPLIKVQYETTAGIIYLIKVSFSQPVSRQLETDLLENWTKRFLPADAVIKTKDKPDQVEFYSDSQDRVYTGKLLHQGKQVQLYLSSLEV